MSDAAAPAFLPACLLSQQPLAITAMAGGMSQPHKLCPFFTPAWPPHSVRVPLSSPVSTGWLGAGSTRSKRWMKSRQAGASCCRWMQTCYAKVTASAGQRLGSLGQRKQRGLGARLRAARAQRRAGAALTAALQQSSACLT
jgi:hypothetical protein